MSPANVTLANVCDVYRCSGHAAVSIGVRTVHLPRVSWAFLPIGPVRITAAGTTGHRSSTYLCRACAVELEAHLPEGALDEH